MRDGEEQEVPFGAVVALTVMAGAAILIPSCILMKPGFDQIERENRKAEAEFLKWEISCKRGGGRVVYNGKGSPTNLCFSKDGRLVSSR